MTNEVFEFAAIIMNNNCTKWSSKHYKLNGVKNNLVICSVNKNFPDFNSLTDSAVFEVVQSFVQRHFNLLWRQNGMKNISVLSPKFGITLS